MSRRGSILRERQERENRKKEREEERIRTTQIQQERLERRINREIQREIIEGNPIISNPIYSPSPQQLRSPLHFIHLTEPREGGELVNSPGLPIPQNSPEEVRHTTSPELQTPPATTFFSAFTSRIERAVQQIISPSRENPQGISTGGNVLDIPIGIELQNSTNNTVFVKMRQFHSLKIRTAQNLVPFVSHYIETFQFIETFFHYNHFIPYTCENEISQFTKTPSIVLCLHSSL
jgi:hypothetical protein